MFNRGGRGLQRGRRDVNDQQRTDASSSAQRQAQGSPSPGAARGNRGGICRREESARNRKTETNQEEKVQGAYGGNAETSWKRGRGGHGRGRGLIKDNQRNQHVGHERPIDQRMYKRDEEVQGAWGGRAASNRGTRGREQHHSAFLRSKSCPPKQFYKQAEAKHSGLNLRHEQGRRLSRDGRGDGRKMGYKALEGLLEKEASEIAITLSSSLAFKALLDEKHMRNDLLQLVCFVLCKAFQSRIFRKNILHLAQTVKDSSFFRVVLPYYVTAMVSDYQQAKGDNLACFLLTKPLEHGVDLPGDFQSEESHTIKSGQYNQHLRNIIRLVSDVLNMFPTSSFVPASMLLNLLKSSINDLRANGVDILKSLDEDLERVDVLIKHLQEKSREGTLRSDKYSFLAVDEEVPVGEEDFRTMSIFPTFEEFHTDHRPLLRQNIVTQNFTSTRIYLDTHFRLLREDFVRPLRDGVKEILKSQHEEGGPMRKKQFDDIRVYINTQVLMPICTPTGIAYKVKFDPEPLRFVRWENSKRLLYGSLVCLSMDNFETFLFAMVCNREPNQLRKGWVDLCFFADGKANLASIRPSHSFLMVETTAYFEAYRYVLEGLQEQEEADLPFQRYIVECSTNVNSPSYLRVEGRTYNLSCIRAKGQKEVPPFNPLTPAAWPDEETMGLDESQLQALKLALTNELAIIQGPPGTGKTHVGLKIAQALLVNHEAWSHNSPMLVVCYTNHALDQFLEGIHSFLKQGIVRVGGRSNSEILKQFTLRQLTSSNEFRNKRPHPIRAAHHAIREEMDTAEETIKRLSLQLKCTLYGVLREEFLQRYISQQHWSSLSFQFVQSRSFLSEWLGLGNLTFQLWQQEPDEEDSAIAVEGTEEAEDLVDIVEEADLIQTERIVVDAEHQQKKTSEQQQRENEMWLEVSDMMLSMSTDENEKQHPVDPSQPAMTEGQWEIQHHQKKKMKDRVKKELKKSSVMSPKEEETIKDVRNLTMENKWRLYRLWVSRYQKYLREKMLNAEQVYQNSAERLNEIRWQDDLRVLRESRVVGMTTTGAAKFRKILQELKPRLVIVEEAAEVLEAHTITTLSRACQHLILIGDHQQLRPSATVYELARNFNLEVSMFERLVRVNFPFIRLNYQHRMRPSIARLLTPNIYENLENHPSVLEYENVKGLSTNLFFVNHSHFEQEIKDGRSHQNTHEAGFVVALCRYLLCQEYKPSQITILTTYTGQLHCLRKLMPLSEFSGVKVHVVDKYQGEENDIVILSLVRSNLLKKVGFLSISNRVCVALSRAKMGLYCIGNIDMLSSVTLWSKILYSLKEHGQAGPTLTLSCQNHPDKQTIVSCADDFKQAPEGGCDQPCLYRLECGHVCTRMCHPYDVDHKKFQCMKDCPKVLCDLKHKCPVRCYQECPKNCYVRLEKVIPFCLHKQQVPCYLNPEMFECQEPCQKILECGHPCKSVCGASCNSFNCQVKVPKQLKCGHLQEEPCFIALDPLSNPRCRSKCKTTLKCGHSCSGTCHKCCQGRLHQGCTYKCKQILVCSHNCTEPCVKDCPPCSFPCQNSCIHSSCKKACGQACTPCNEPCAWQCPHYSCTKLCHEPCDRPPCLVPCRNILPCKHQCIGLCGDPCPDKCRDCDASEVQEIFFGNEDESDARFIQLEDCRHIFESAGMDRYMSIDEEQNAELAQRAIRLKDCPRCRTPIRRNLRYGTHINRSLAAIEMVKNKISGVEPNIEEKQKVLRMQLYDNRILRDFLPKEFLSLKEKLQEKFTSSQQLWKLENLTAFLESVGKLKQIEVEQKINDHSEEFARFLQECLDFLFDSHQRFSDQQVADLDRELKRLSYLAELNVRCEKTSSESPELYPEVQELREILGNTLPFTEKHELKVKDIFVKLETKLPCSGLGITDEERIMIVKVIGLPKGHWYKCENGHVYAIGDCGGAMVQSKCPECNSVIGGQNHTLVQGNAVASEMDGAEHSAWSNAANLAIPHHNLF